MRRLPRAGEGHEAQAHPRVEAAEYQRFTEALRQRLEAEVRVVGLVALGSMAGRDYAPDEFSDHDFFVVTRPGAQEPFRAEAGWVSEAGKQVLCRMELTP